MPVCMSAFASSFLPVHFHFPPSISACRSSQSWRWRCNISAPLSSAVKEDLLSKFSKLDFGRVVAKDPAAQKGIDEEVRQLEALNPVKEPVNDDRLNGKWRMVYTTSKSILGISRPKLFRPMSMVQTIDVSNNSVRNKESVKIGPLSITSAVEALITNTTPTRVTVRFLKFIFLGFITVNVANDGSFIGWQEITYLDDDLRVSRGNEGNLFVLVKE